MSKTCFVIQPFDETFNKRYLDVFKPAIESVKVDDTNLKAYKVDEDYSVSIPIDEIEKQINNSKVCFADITRDNPNVWFELGYALALRKDVCLICSEERTAKYPFDVQHRTIISYKTGSISDFNELKSKIQERLKGLLVKQEQMNAILHLESDTIPSEGLQPHEIAVLVSIMKNYCMDESISGWQIISEVEKSGYTELATNIAIKNLLTNGMIIGSIDSDFNGNEYKVFKLTDSGMDWISSNQHKLILKSEKANNIVPQPPRDDEIPF